MTVIQRVASCFAAVVLGALAVVLFSHVLFALGISEKLGVKEPIPLKSPDIYRPLLGWAVGDPVRALDRCRLDAPVPFRPSLLPRARAGAVSDFPADERRGAFRGWAGRSARAGSPAAG